MPNLTDQSAVDSVKRCLQSYRGRLDMPTISELETAITRGTLNEGQFASLARVVQEADPRNTDLISRLKYYAGDRGAQAPKAGQQAGKRQAGKKKAKPKKRSSK